MAESVLPDKTGFALGLAMAINQIAVVLVRSALGLLKDMTGSYRPGWSVLVALTTLSLLVTRRHDVREKGDHNMTIPYLDSTKNVRKTIGYLILLGGVVFLTGCPDTEGKTKPAPVAPPPVAPTPGGGGSTGGSSEPKISVGEPPFSVTLNENGPETLVTLPYTSQGGAVPTSCKVSSPLMVTVTKPCACSEGICCVGVQPTPKFFGDGSFEFRLSGQSGQKETSSNTGKASVKVLEVTLSIFSGDKQEGVVGTNLPAPIVVLVQNSNRTPVSGVKVFWDIEKRKYIPVFLSEKEEKEKWFGEVSCEDTDNQGLARCTWTLGTKILHGLNTQIVKVSAFHKLEENYKNTLVDSFSASVKPGSAAVLSFWSQNYYELEGIGFIYSGPALLYKAEKVNMPLGEKNFLAIYARDQYGNAATVKDGVAVTLSLKEKPGGASLLGASTQTMFNKPLTYSREGQAWGWTQGLAKFEDVKVDRVGSYTFSATASDPDLRVEDVDRWSYSVK